MIPMGKNKLRPALAAFLLMLTMSLLSTALSFFVSPVCADLGFGRGSFTLYYSLMVAAGAVSASFLGTYMNKHGVRGVVLVSALWCGAGAWVFSFSNALWMFYVAGGLMGFVGSTCVYLAANVIVQQSYSGTNASAILGLVMAGSGIGGVIWSNLFPKLISELGWRFGYRVLGICWTALALLALVILGKRDLTGGIGHAHTAGDGASKQEALRSPKFFLAAYIMCAITVCSCISQQLPAVLGGMGRGEGEISLMLSVMTAFVAVGSVAEGVLCSRFGIVRTLVTVLVLYAVGFGLLALGIGVYPALGGSALGTLMPVVVRQLFGGRDYAAIWSVVISCSSVASFMATPGWGMVYDTFGTYTPALVAMPVLLALAVTALTMAIRKAK
jgi:MFS family permease